MLLLLKKIFKKNLLKT